MEANRYAVDVAAAMEAGRFSAALEAEVELMTDMELMAEQFGQFYFRRPNAESSADVFDRVGSFVGSLRRMWSFESVHVIKLTYHYLALCPLRAATHCSPQYIGAVRQLCHCRPFAVH